MPRPGRGPYLWFDEARGRWTICDGKRRIRTGSAKAGIEEAKQALNEYLGRSHVQVATDEPSIADILLAYKREHVPHTSSPDIIGYRIGSLVNWWADRNTLADITTANCRAYVIHRENENIRKAGDREIAKARREKRLPDIATAEAEAPAGTTGARGDLEVLRAAIGYWHREKKPLKVLPVVWLPQKPDARGQWLTRSQLAALLWASRRTAKCNLELNPEKKPRLVRHLARFILLAYYTGSRSGVVLGTRYRMLDFANNSMLRKPHGARKTKKQAPPHKMPARLKSWLMRWQRIDGAKADYVVHNEGAKLTKLRRSWGTARDAAGLPEDVTPHTLRHSRATHLMRNRSVANEDAAQFLGMTLQTFLDTYGHHDPEWQKDAADAR